MHLKKIALAIFALTLAAVGGVVVLAAALAIGAIVLLTRLLTGHRRRRISHSPPASKDSSKGDAIDVAATEIPSD